MTNHDNVALRTKLLEALHTAPHKMKATGLPNHGEPSDKQNVRYQRGDAASHKQNSGSSHADLFAQKKAPPNTGTKLHNQISNRKKPAVASIPDTEQKVQEKFAFSFYHREEKDGSIKSHSSKYGSPRSERKKIPADSKGKYRKEVCVSANGRGKRMPPRKKEKDFAYSPPKAKKRGVQMPKDTPQGSSDDTTETTESPDTESPSMEEVEVEEFTESPIEEEDARCAKGLGKPNKSSGTLRQTKRVRIHEDAKPSKINLSTLSPTGTTRTDGTAESASEAHMASKSFSQMESVLKGFDTKLKSHTSKKGSEILSSALDKVRVQLQAVDSHIQTDLGKLTNVGKSKRRRLESTFQEQQERLKRLHDKFKEEVNQQILDCRTTIEELDAYQLELKGTAERQRASHKKLVMQAEESMKVQISDVDTCIQAVNKEATHKMSGLKLVLDEWITEGRVC